MNTIVITGKDTKKILNSQETGAKKLRGREWADIGRRAEKQRTGAQAARDESGRSPKRSPKPGAGQNPRTTTPH